MKQGGLAVAAAIWVMVAAGSTALAGESQPKLSLVGGTGIPGGTVSVTLALADDDGAGVSAGIDMLFEDDKLDFFPPVSASCDVDPRIASTHGIAGRILEPGVLNIEIFVLGTPDPLPPLGNGALASCDFRIADDAPLGTSPVGIDSPFLGDDTGMQIPVITEDGFVTIAQATATPTVTNTIQVTPTATPTDGGNTPTSTATPSVDGNTPTATPTTPSTEGPTNTATPTRTGTVQTPVQTATSTPTGEATATATRTANTPTRTATAGKRDNDDGCNVVPAGSSDFEGTLALLLAPAILIWMRRRA